MNKAASWIVLLATVVLPGCGGGDTPESVSKAIVANFKEMATILTSITDEASAKAAVPKIEAVRAKMRDAGNRAKALPKVSAAEEQKLNEALMSNDMVEAQRDIAAAMQKLMDRPELQAIIEPALQNMQDDL